MNLNLYKSYRLSMVKLVSNTSGTVYEATISKQDRFYQYMKDYIIAERVEGQTKEPIDELSVKDPNKTFLSEDTFTLTAVLMAEDSNEVSYSYDFAITRVQFNFLKNSKCEYANGWWNLTLPELQIPYHTVIEIKERKDD